MKKMLFIILSLILAFYLTACDNSKTSDNSISHKTIHQSLVTDAIAELKFEWKDIYKDNQKHFDCNGYLKLRIHES